jgi:hypothetical protein
MGVDPNNGTDWGRQSYTSPQLRVRPAVKADERAQRACLDGRRTSDTLGWRIGPLVPARLETSGIRHDGLNQALASRGKIATRRGRRLHGRLC